MKILLMALVVAGMVGTVIPAQGGRLDDGANRATLCQTSGLIVPRIVEKKPTAEAEELAPSTRKVSTSTTTSTCRCHGCCPL